MQSNNGTYLEEQYTELDALSDSVLKTFQEEVSIDGLQIKTKNGWQDIASILVGHNAKVGCLNF